MRDRVYNYLKNAGKPLPAKKILRDVLHIQLPASAAADKILAAIVGTDSRISFSYGFWQMKEARDIPGWENEFAVLCMESIDQGRQLRGAIRFASGLVSEFESSAETSQKSCESVCRARLQLGERPIAAWSAEDIRLWKQLLRWGGIPEWHGEMVSLRSIAARLLNRPVGTVDIASIASMLHTPAPADCCPKIMVRFVADCFPALLDRIPPEFRTDTKALLNWISQGSILVDFSRFGFDRNFLRQLPESPGVYVMKDRAGTAIYVGQSRNLKRRVRSYFVSGVLQSVKARKIHQQLYSIEIHPAGNGVEALILEMRLIRRLRPTINLQTKIHSRAQDYGRKNLLLLIHGESARPVATIYFLQEGRFTGKQSVRFRRSPDSKLRERIKRAYFSKRQNVRRRDTWEMEIISRWLSQNARSLNWVDVDETGNFGNVIARLSDYLHDPEELREKVYYR